MRAAFARLVILSSWTAGTTADVSFTDDGGAFQAVAVIATTNGIRNESSSSVRDKTRVFGFGSSATNRGCVCSYSEDENAPGAITQTAITNQALVYRVSDTDTGALDIVSLGNGTFRVIVDDQFAADCTVQFLVLGGGGLVVGDMIEGFEPGGAASQDFDVPGFELKSRDQVVFFIGAHAADAIPDLNVGGGQVSFGVAVSANYCVNNAVWAGGSANGVDPTQTASYCRRTECIAGFADSMATLESRASVDAWLTDGFRLTWSSSVAGRAFLALPIKGGEWRVDSFNLLPALPIGTVHAYTVGFNAAAMMFFNNSRANATPQVESAAGVVDRVDALSVGILDRAGAQGHTGHYDEDADGSPSIVLYEDHSQDAWMTYGPGSVSAECSGEITENGFELTVTDANNTSVFTWWLAFGPWEPTPMEHPVIDIPIDTETGIGQWP